jgi:diaminopimelate decarboxylase
VRKQALATDVRTSEELAVAVANGIHPARIVVHGDTMSDLNFSAPPTSEWAG